MPPHLWARSERPGVGKVVPKLVPLALGVAGLLADGSVRVGLIGAAVLSAILIPALIEHGLENLARKVQDANREQARELQRSLRSLPLVSLFAPSAWVTLQEAQLALRLGDGAEAARLFVETGRRCRRPDAVMLVSAQAHALVVANERKPARELLNKLAATKLLGPRDQLDLAIVLLLDSQSKGRQAMAYLEAARKTIGDHPRVVAAMALGLQRLERIDEAAELLEKAAISLQEEPDPVVEVLVHRTRANMRRYIEAQLRRERRARSRRTTVIVTSEHAVSEVISGEIATRRKSGAVPQAEATEATAEPPGARGAAEGDASLRARGWNDPHQGASKSPEEVQPKVRVGPRDPNLGEAIRIEGSYALRTREEIERDHRPKERRQRRARPALDLDLDLDLEEEDVDPAESATEQKSATETAPPASDPEAIGPGEETAAAPQPAGLHPANKSQETGEGAVIPILTSGEGSDLRRRGTLSESLAETLGALDSGLRAPPPLEGEGDDGEERERSPGEGSAPAIEADAPQAMRRRRTSTTGVGLPKPPPFPSLLRGLGTRPGGGAGEAGEAGEAGKEKEEKKGQASDPGRASFRSEAASSADKSDPSS